LSAELTKKRTLSDCFFGDFDCWARRVNNVSVMNSIPYL